MEAIPGSEFNYSIPMDKEMICQRNKQQALRFFNHDFTVYEEIVAENITIYGPATGQETRGVEAAKRLDMGYATAYPNAEYKIQDIFAAEDKVVVRWTVKGTQTGHRKGLQLSGTTQDLMPTNRGIILNGIHVYRFNGEGKITESWAMWDRLGELEQIADISVRAKSQIIRSCDPT